MKPPPAGAARRERLPREIRALACAAFVIAIGHGLVAPALPLFATSFGATVTAASAVISAFALTRIGFAPFSGRLIGRVGELRVFCGGLLIVAMSSAACAFAIDYPQLLLFRAAGGIGSTMFTVSTAALLIRISPPALRGRASGAWATGFLLGNIVGPVVGGGLMESLRAPFLGYAALLLITVVVTGGLLRGQVGPGLDPDHPGTAVVTFTAAFRHRSFRASLISNLVQGWTVYGVRIAIVPLFIVAELGQPASRSGLVLTAFAAGTAITLMISGRLADRRGRKSPILAGTAIVAITSLWLGLSHGLVEAVAAALLSGVGTGLLNPPVNASIGDVIAANGRDVHGGTALAGFQMIGDVGAVIGPVLAGMIVETSGYPAAFATTAAIASLSFCYWLRAPETLSR